MIRGTTGLLGLLGLTAGCDLVFRLERAPLDASPGDGPVDAFFCPPTYSPAGDSMYRVLTQAGSWASAEGLCRTDGNGTHLVVLGNDAERALVGSMTTSLTWIGLTDRVTQGSWIWLTDEATAYPPITTPPWYMGEPTNGPDEDCAVIDINEQLRDRTCDEPHAAVCECDGYPVVMSRF